MNQNKTFWSFFGACLLLAGAGITATFWSGFDVSSAQSLGSSASSADSSQNPNSIDDSSGARAPASLNEGAPGSTIEKASPDEVGHPPTLEGASAPQLPCRTLKFRLREGIPSPLLSQLPTYKNSLPLPNSNFLAHKFCVRVDGRAVPHKIMQSKKNTLMIENVAHSSSKVEITACNDNAHCPLKCDIQKDSFLSALGADEDLTQVKPRRGPASAEDAELDRHTADIQKLLVMSQENTKVFNGWMVLSEEDSSCGKTTQAVTRRE